tara:strand:- start:477 stop:860 length:384 start_codon:yes stop_codon:yes gene_type:complete
MRYLKYPFSILSLVLLLNSSVLAGQTLSGPPIFCDKEISLKKALAEYKEENFLVLLQGPSEPASFILHRNMNTGSWSIVAYNVVPDKVCLMLGGHSSFILPDIKQVNKMLKRQDKGLEVIKPEEREM